jgi:hypothetical protein
MSYFEPHATCITIGDQIIRLADCLHGQQAVSIAEYGNRRLRDGDSEPDVIADIIKAYGAKI